jgi:DNA-directed RNA polymerase specialized sigma24 family protein
MLHTAGTPLVVRRFQRNATTAGGVLPGERESVGGRPLDDDAQLIESARGGDIGAFEQLVERYQHVAIRVAHVVCGADDAADVTQEAFVKVWQALPRFRSGAPVRPWLLSIVANEARNTRRAAGRRARLALRATEDRLPAT